MSEIKFGPEDIIYNQDDDDCSLYIILDGQIEMYHETFNGTRNTLEILESR